jgi:hypothetical protein
MEELKPVWGLIVTGMVTVLPALPVYQPAGDVTEKVGMTRESGAVTVIPPPFAVMLSI